ncbi:hypothetical protein E1262_18200 [Jiangella aurantiaca]|uniref:Uncharacterized protein n=2 Tax=Jiangella aurantiaca TaxID=2530373 RepID=A0A4R5AA23_9ACTN|nr:hypothetical protein E1262_18200 [Jiangella aurantiaca]
MDIVVDHVMLVARALVLRDLGARRLDVAAAVDVLDAALTERRWWVEQWPDGAAFVAGQLAQDVQDRLLDAGVGRWPSCESCVDEEPHELRIEPELGPDPQWVCEKTGRPAAPLGAL